MDKPQMQVRILPSPLTNGKENEMKNDIATITLFKALPVKIKKKKKPSKELLRETVKRGFVFSPEVISNYPETELLSLAKDIGLSPEQINTSFHKSWKKVRDTDIKQLIVEQIIHYFSTYGLERLGIYNKDLIYIPDEELKIPKTKMKNINLVVIKGYTKGELKMKLLKLLSSGIALKEDTITAVVDVALFIGLDEGDVETIKNKEVRVVMYEYLNIIPDNPIEFLRYVTFIVTDSSLLIKSRELIEKIKLNMENTNA